MSRVGLIDALHQCFATCAILWVSSQIGVRAFREVAIEAPHFGADSCVRKLVRYGRIFVLESWFRCLLLMRREPPYLIIKVLEVNVSLKADFLQDESQVLLILRFKRPDDSGKFRLCDSDRFSHQGVLRDQRCHPSVPLTLELIERGGERCQLAIQRNNPHAPAAQRLQQGFVRALVCPRNTDSRIRRGKLCL